MKEEKINEISRKIQLNMKELKEQIETNSPYCLENNKDTLDEEKMIKSLLSYITATYVGFEDVIEIETIKFDRCYNISFRGEHQDLIQNADVVLTYMETVKYAKGDDYFPTVQIIPVITIRTQKEKYLYINGECESLISYDFVEIRPDGIYGRVSNFDDKQNVITTIFRGDVIIPNDKKNEAKWLSDIEPSDILLLGIGVNKGLISESNNISKMEEQRKTMKPNC